MSQSFYDRLTETLAEIDADGLYKRERTITSQQYSEIDVRGTDGTERHVLNFCANNYLGLADSDALAEAGKAALDRYGFGMASVRFICGTQEEHTELEARISSCTGWREISSGAVPVSIQASRSATQFAASAATSQRTELSGGSASAQSSVLRLSSV